MKGIFSLLFFLLAFLFSCGKENLRLDDFRDYKIKVKTKTHRSVEMKYSISIPETWAENKDSQSLDGNFFEEFIDTTSSVSLFTLDMMDFCLFNVDKKKSEAPALQDYFEDIKAGLMANHTDGSWKLFESGKTDFLKYESYFIHYRGFLGAMGEMEGFIFLIKAKEEMTYYSISIVVPRKNKDKLRDRVGMLLTCARSFEMN